MGSKDCQLVVSCSGDKMIKVWSPRKFQEIASFENIAEVSSVALSEDTNWVFSGDWDGKIKVWNVNEKK